MGAEPHVQSGLEIADGQTSLRLHAGAITGGSGGADLSPYRIRGPSTIRHFLLSFSDRRFAPRFTLLASAYPVASAKRDILGAAEPSTTTPGGELKGPDKHVLARM